MIVLQLGFAMVVVYYYHNDNSWLSQWQIDYVFLNYSGWLGVLKLFWILMIDLYELYFEN